MKKLLPFLFVAAMVGAHGQVSAEAVLCSTADATANSKQADDCYGDFNLANGASPTDEAAAVNGQFTLDSTGDDFFFVDKDEAGATNGFLLTVEDGGSGIGGDYSFLYRLTVPEEYVGLVVDWVLGIKQNNESYVAYLFTGVRLDIDGGFNSFTLNPAGHGVIDYSHASGFIRPSSQQVPEPISLALMGVGLLGLGAARRFAGRKSA